MAQSGVAHDEVPRSWIGKIAGKFLRVRPAGKIRKSAEADVGVNAEALALRCEPAGEEGNAERLWYRYATTQNSTSGIGGIAQENLAGLKGLGCSSEHTLAHPGQHMGVLVTVQEIGWRANNLCEAGDLP